MRLNNARKWACDRLTEDADFGKKLIFSDEAHFDHFETRTHTLKSRHPQNESLFDADFGQIFFENEQGEAVNSDRYSIMFNEFLFTQIEEEDIGNICFQQDGAMYHTAEATLDVLRLVFEDRIISRRADVVWPSRSCNLTPLDYYMWDVVKDNCSPSSPRQLTL